MSGAVVVVPVVAGMRAGSFDVLCFRSDCWDHGEYGCAIDPVVAEADERTEATKAAKDHRREISRQGEARCPRCKAPDVAGLAADFESLAWESERVGRADVASTWAKAATRLRDAVAGPTAMDDDTTRTTQALRECAGEAEEASE